MVGKQTQTGTRIIITRTRGFGESLLETKCERKEEDQTGMEPVTNWNFNPNDWNYQGYLQWIFIWCRRKN